MEPAFGQTTKARILVVDDEPSITDAVGTALHYEGFEVKEVGRGNAALSEAVEFRPDLIVLDIMLPDIDGLEVTQRLRRDGLKTPVLFLTARDATDDKITGLTVGADDYMTKPFSLGELIARVQAILRRAGHDDDAGVPRFADLVMRRTPDGRLAMHLAWRTSLRAALDGQFEEAERQVFETHAKLALLDPHEAVDATGGQLALLYWLSDRLEVLVPLLQIALDEQPYMTTAFGPVLALAQIHAGQTAEASALLASMELDHADRPPEPMLRSGTVSALASACFELGDPDLVCTALRLLGDDRTSPTIIDHVGVFYLGARATYRGMLELRLGEVDDAVASLERGLAVNERMSAVVFAMKTQMHLVEALRRRHATGDHERALQLVRTAGATAERLGLVPSISGRSTSPTRWRADITTTATVPPGHSILFIDRVEANRGSLQVVAAPNAPAHRGHQRDRRCHRQRPRAHQPPIN